MYPTQAKVDRVILVHTGPSDECPCRACGDGTCDDDYGQGRTRASYEWSLKACAIAALGIALTFIVAVVYAAVRS